MRYINLRLTYLLTCLVCSGCNWCVKCVQQLYLECVTSRACTSTAQSLDVLATMINKLVDELIVCEDKQLEATKHLTTTSVGHVLDVVDHTRHYEAFVSRHVRALSQLTSHTYTHSLLTSHSLTRPKHFTLRHTSQTLVPTHDQTANDNQ